MNTPPQGSMQKMCSGVVAGDGAPSSFIDKGHHFAATQRGVVEDALDDIVRHRRVVVVVGEE